MHIAQSVFADRIEQKSQTRDHKMSVFLRQTPSSLIEAKPAETEVKSKERSFCLKFSPHTKNESQK